MDRELERAVAQVLTEMLAIAKVAMPDFLYDIDPRVHRARQLIATLDQRSPAIQRHEPETMVNLNESPTRADVDQTSGAEPPWDITVALDAFMQSDLAPANRTEAVILILRDWMIGYGYLDLVPEPRDVN